MEGFYVYGLRKGLGISSAFSTPGIDEKGRVSTRTFQDLEAIISEVSLEEFDSETIRVKARNDLQWIKEKAVLHETVLEEAMRNGEEIVSLIPMKFGTIFKDETALREALTGHWGRFRETLERLEGKQEWGAKAYLTNRNKFERTVKEKSPAFKDKEREIAALPEGMAFFMEEELQDILSREANGEMNRVVEALDERLSRQAEASVRIPVLGRELIGRSEPMVFNAACLIAKERIEEFQETARRIDHEIRDRGLHLAVSGPWPAYHFATPEK